MPGNADNDNNQCNDKVFCSYEYKEGDVFMSQVRESPHPPQYIFWYHNNQVLLFFSFQPRIHSLPAESTCLTFLMLSVAANILQFRTRRYQPNYREGRHNRLLPSRPACQVSPPELSPYSPDSPGPPDSYTPLGSWTPASTVASQVLEISSQ